ncbi:MAG: SPOR domain-containing protein [Candidatus Omnitrophica bacterium]|nr:SPOR domain-containing protein [Candidatus Omnitrophota bacterium]
MGPVDPKKKKSDGLNTLSETEIQNRLYGTYRAPHREEKQQPGKTEARVNSVSPVDFNRPHGKSLDLFTSPSSTTRLVSAAPTTESVPKLAIPSSKWLEQELKGPSQNPVKLSTPGKALTGMSRENVKPERQGPSAVVEFLRIVTGFFIRVSLSLVRLLRVKDSLKPNQNKNIYWTGGVAILALILMGIHSLNNQRERAMMSPHHNPKKIMPQVKEVKVTEGADFTSLSLSTKSKETAELMPRDEKQAPKPNSGNQEVTSPYVIQVATYANLADAEKKLGMIKMQSFPGFIQSLKRQSGRVYHCVFVGRFKTFEEAEKVLNNFKTKDFSESFPDVFIRSLK